MGHQINKIIESSIKDKELLLRIGIYLMNNLLRESSVSKTRKHKIQY